MFLDDDQLESLRLSVLKKVRQNSSSPQGGRVPEGPRGTNDVDTCVCLRAATALAGLAMGIVSPPSKFVASGSLHTPCTLYRLQLGYPRSLYLRVVSFIDVAIALESFVLSLESLLASVHSRTLAYTRAHISPRTSRHRIPNSSSDSLTASMVCTLTCRKCCQPTSFASLERFHELLRNLRSVTSYVCFCKH